MEKNEQHKLIQKKNKTIVDSICYLLLFLIVIYSFGPTLGAGWGVIDDHEIMHFIGRNYRLQLQDVITVLQGTELNMHSETPRYRPTYYILRLIECFAWGKDPALWYLARVAIALFFGFSLIKLSLSLTNPLLTIGFIFYAMSSSYWLDIFARLGPAEVYAAFGLSFFIVGLLRIKVLPSSWTAIFLISIGILIMVGSKENFLVFGIAPIFVMYFLWHRLTLGRMVILSIPVFFAVWITGVVFLRLAGQGTDIYAGDVSLINRLQILKQVFMSGAVQLWSFQIFILTLLWFSKLKVMCMSRFGGLHIHLQQCLLINATLFFIYISQVVFYGSGWPINSSPRYLFPAYISMYFGIYLCFCCALEIIFSIISNRKSEILICLGIALGLTVISGPSLSKIRLASIKVADETRLFESHLQAIISALMVSSNITLVIDVNSPWDFEPMYSLARYLRSCGLDNSIAIRLNGFTSDTIYPSMLERNLAARMEKISQEGDGEYFTGLKWADPSKCVSAGIGILPAKKCSYGAFVM